MDVWARRNARVPRSKKLEQTNEKEEDDKEEQGEQTEGDELEEDDSTSRMLDMPFDIFGED